mmetsp:Transcript_10878/g.19361  ORF Transcript_10878/g.19361 Transcript_10878/m.19361 type:complete len:87 (-) Transcript_10878:8-268(-)
MSAWAVPLLIFFGMLCQQDSYMIDLDSQLKKDAVWGCYGSAVLYGLTFLGAYNYKQKLSRQVILRPEFLSEMVNVAGYSRSRDHVD